MPPIDRQRATRLIREAGLDALVLTQPENVAYALGVGPGLASNWRQAGAAMALIPSDADAPMAAVMSDLNVPPAREATGLDIRPYPIWVDAVDLRGIDLQQGAVAALAQGYARAEHPVGTPRPATWRRSDALDRLSDLLNERGLQRARIGIELKFAPVADFAAFQSRLPEVRWVDASTLVERMRAVKTPDEIAKLRAGAELSEASMDYMLRHARAGMRRAEVIEVFREGTRQAAAARGVTLVATADNISVGPSPWGGDGLLEPGALVKVDTGVNVGGYYSDCARTFCLGQPHPVALEIYAVLREAFETGIAMFLPGVALADIHARVLGSIRGSGIAGFSRGHFGHGIGSSVWGEEWPYIAAESHDVLIEPGMVLSFETPFYAEGIGGMIIEDQMVITATGADIMTRRPRELVSF